MAQIPRIGIAGARGRMGRAVAAELEAQALTPAALIGRPGAGADFVSAADALPLCDVIIDFSTAPAAASLASAAAHAGGPALVIGPTGFTADQESQIADAAARIAIVKAGNFSIGVTILLALVRTAAQRLPAQEWDIEILEAHHRTKRDAPSGTALALAAAASGAGRKAADGPRTGERQEGEIGYAVTRAGALVGEHAVIFAAEGEILTLAHSARDRRIFAAGALAAARWVAAMPAGLYSMEDVLGF